MNQVVIKFPDGSTRNYDSGVSGNDIAKSISPRLAKEALAVLVNGVMRDLSAPIETGSPVEVLTFEQAQGKQVFWHSSSHIMAQAVVELFPSAKVTIGPPIKEGWYYDFEVPRPFTPEDIEKIEQRMSEIIKENSNFEFETRARSDAIEYYRSLGNEYKTEILDGIEDETVTFYKHSSFVDLCRGPHVPRTGVIKSFKLTATSGAYWRGDEKRTMLQRIYGVSFPKKKMLEDFIYLHEEAKKRDHRLLGKQLELYAISEEVGAGLVLWLPKGARIRNQIENFWREEHLRCDYELVFSPHIAHRDLWERSGHTDFYDDSMFAPMVIDEKQYQLKPMNCPFHIIMYKLRRWSYRDLPIRWAELGTVYRYERPGVLHGLMRVRGFTQDDAHHFVTPEKMEDELVWILDFCLHILRSFGFSEFEVMLSTRPEKSIGDPADWTRAETGLQKALDRSGLEYVVDEGAGAFYGPKIDLNIKDALGRSWQCSTIQFDFSLPERFDLSYIDQRGEQVRPYMIHRALLGSIERFFGILVEHYAGNFPLWLAPVQVKVLPITDEFNELGRNIVDELKGNGFRAAIDSRSEKVNAKIRDAELMKVPYMMIIGAREAESGTVALRKHGQGNLGSVPLSEAVKRLKAEVSSKGLPEPSEEDK